jgi:hypothetical protein
MHPLNVGLSIISDIIILAILPRGLGMRPPAGRGPGGVPVAGGKGRGGFNCFRASSQPQVYHLPVTTTISRHDSDHLHLDSARRTSYHHLHRHPLFM